MTKMKGSSGPLSFLFLFMSSWISGTSGLNDGLHLTPMMGFSSWNTFFGLNNEEKMIGIADAIKRLELDTFGYVYLTVDDFWMTPDRDADGNIQTNLSRSDRVYLEFKEQKKPLFSFVINYFSGFPTA